jgi:hypothetical protein
MRYWFLPAVLLLNGCFFAYFPMPGGKGDTCVGERVVVGQRIENKDNGAVGTVTALHGRSERCQRGDVPILATVEYK